MMALPENNNSEANATVTKDNKHPCSSSMPGSARRTEAPSVMPPEQALKCPRCDSTNTKFCYYNNYSLTQPRHFCKTCRRYWTKGGALRNVPIGGGCRKSKKAKSGSRLDSSGDSSSSSDIVGAPGFKFLSPAVDFPAASGISFPRFHSKFSTSYEVSGFGAEQVGGFRSTYSLPSPASVGFVAAAAAGGGSMNVHGTVATSIESLGCMNKELHWKLQQQRLASVVFGAVGDNHYRSSNHKDSTDSLGNPAEVIKPQATGSSLLQSLEGSRLGTSAAAAEEWFFGCSVPPAANAAVQLGAKSRGGGGGQEGSSGSGGWNEGQGWTSDLLPYSGMPYLANANSTHST